MWIELCREMENQARSQLLAGFLTAASTSDSLAVP